MHLKSYQLPQKGPIKNGKNLFLTKTQKIEKCFLIFFLIIIRWVNIFFRKLQSPILALATQGICI